MFDAIFTGLHILALAAGVILLYIGLFVYEGEEAQVKSILENWWVHADDLKQTSVSRHLALMRASGQFANATLDRLFGRKIISFRTISVTACLSLISLHITTVFHQKNHYLFRAGFRDILVDHFDFSYPDAKELAIFLDYTLEAFFSRLYMDLDEFLRYLDFTTSLAFIVIVLPIFLKRMYWLPTSFVFSLAGITVYDSLTKWPFVLKKELILIPPEPMTLITVFLGVLCDVIALSIIRLLLRWQIDWTSCLKTFLSAIAQLFLAVGLIIVPLFLGTYGMLDMKFSYTVSGNIVKAVSLTAFTNILGSLTALTFFISGILLVLHRAAWPLIERPLYQIGKLYNSSGGKAFSASLGAALILIGSGKSVDLVSFVLQKFRLK